MPDSASTIEFNALLDQIGDGVPGTEQYQRLSALILDFPQARMLTGMDPFSPGYKSAAMELYLTLRGRAEQGYVATRDEAAATGTPDDLWTGLVPWSFRDAKMASEHLFAWGHILGHLNLPKDGSVLEYGPGSGQVLLMLARMGYRACGVDVDAVALDNIRAQAEHLHLQVELERTEFGLGFEGRTFDSILFYEAFHHAFDFDALLVRLHGRLNPGGRIVLCGEPVVSAASDGIPYPWGPRLDALSVFCMRRFGWMELGFTHDYLMKIAEVTGWTATFHPFPNCGRAAIYVLEAAQPQSGTSSAGESLLAEQVRAQQRELAVMQSELAALRGQVGTLQGELGAMRRSTSWRITGPLRASKTVLAQTLSAGRNRSE